MSGSTSMSESPEQSAYSKDNPFPAVVTENRVLNRPGSAKETRHQTGGFGLANAAIEALTRGLAGEYGRSGVRVVGMRANFTPETYPGMTAENLAPLLNNTTLGRLPRLAELAGTAVYLASDRAGAVSGAMVNLTCGAIVD